MHRLRPLPVLLLLCLAACPALAGAQTTDAERPPAELPGWGEETRVLRLVASGGGFDYTSSRDSPLGQDVIRGNFELDEARLRYEFETLDPTNRSTFYKTDLYFVALIEFRDSDGDGRYSLPDEVLQRVTLSSLEAARMDPPTPAAGGSYLVVAHYPFKPPPADDLPLPGQPGSPIGEFAVQFVVTPESRTIDGRAVNPVEVAVDITIADFPYNQTSGTLLAVETRSRSNVELSALPDRLVGRSGLYQGYFLWTEPGRGAPPATGVTVLEEPAVGPTGSLGQQQVTVLYTYPRQDRVQHATALGMARFKDTPAPQAILDTVVGDSALFAAGAAVAIVAVAGTAFVRLRRG